MTKEYSSQMDPSVIIQRPQTPSVFIDWKGF